MPHQNARLTTRELEVARLISLGRTNREIAGELFLSVGTVNAHVHSILGKLDASRRAAIASWYAETSRFIE